LIPMGKEASKATTRNPATLTGRPAKLIRVNENRSHIANLSDLLVGHP